MSGVVGSPSLSSKAKGLAGVSAADEVNGFDVIR